MRHDAESADSLLTQLAQLRADLALARAVCDQLHQELREERARVAALRDRRLRRVKMRVRRSRPPRDALY